MVCVSRPSQGVLHEICMYVCMYVSCIFNNLLNNSFLILNLTHFPSAFQKFIYFEGTCISFLVPCAITFFKISVLKSVSRYC